MAKKTCRDKDLPRKFERWQEENHVLVRDLLFSLFHPLHEESASTILNDTVAVLVFKELEDGFRVKAIGKRDKKEILGAKESVKVSEGKKVTPGVSCMSVFVLEAIDAVPRGKRSNMGLSVSILGYDLASVIERVKNAKNVQDEIIRRLNTAE